MSICDTFMLYMQLIYVNIDRMHVDINVSHVDINMLMYLACWKSYVGDTVDDFLLVWEFLSS